MSLEYSSPHLVSFQLVFVEDDYLFKSRSNASQLSSKLSSRELMIGGRVNTGNERRYPSTIARTKIIPLSVLTILEL